MYQGFGKYTEVRTRQIQFEAKMQKLTHKEKGDNSKSKRGRPVILVYKTMVWCFVPFPGLSLPQFASYPLGLSRLVKMCLVYKNGSVRMGEW